jgi:hypothetical protein
MSQQTARTHDEGLGLQRTHSAQAGKQDLQSATSMWSKRTLWAEMVCCCYLCWNQMLQSALLPAASTLQDET